MSEKNVQARIKYWADMTPAEKFRRMSLLAKKKQKALTFKQRRDHAMRMVEARRRKQIEKLKPVV